MDSYSEKQLKLILGELGDAETIIDDLKAEVEDAIKGAYDSGAEDARLEQEQKEKI